MKKENGARGLSTDISWTMVIAMTFTGEWTARHNKGRQKIPRDGEGALPNEAEGSPSRLGIVIVRDITTENNEGTGWNIHMMVTFL